MIGLSLIDTYLGVTLTYVATFFGSPAMNILDGVIILEGTQTFVRIGTSQITLPWWPQAANGTAIKQGIRPEHLRRASVMPMMCSLG